MKQKRFTDEQIAFALRQAESGAAVTEITRKLSVSEHTFYRWKRKCAGLGIAELRRLHSGRRRVRPSKTVYDSRGADGVIKLHFKANTNKA